LTGLSILIQPSFTSAVRIADHHASGFLAHSDVITITGFGDHNQPEWLITFTGIRSVGKLVRNRLT